MATRSIARPVKRWRRAASCRCRRRCTTTRGRRRRRSSRSTSKVPSIFFTSTPRTTRRRRPARRPPSEISCAVMLNQTVIDSFKAALRGELIDPQSPNYDAARKVYNGMIDRRPRLIARCADVADVIASVNFAREQQLLVSIRGGGHNAGGLGVCDDGLVIDLSPIKYVRVDPAKRTVVAGGGSLWGDVDHATHAFGLAVPSGIISTTGVGGLTLGGGIGHLTRQCGLTIDNMLSVDMVLADGRF